MAGQRHGRVAAGTAIIVVLFGTMSAPACEPLYGCDQSDLRLGSRLDTLAVLDLRPPGATLLDQDSGCDDDGLYAIAYRRYRAIGTAAETRAFYRDVLPAAGWTQDARLLAKTKRLCFTKSVDGTATTLSLYHDAGTQDFEVDVRASRREKVRCADFA